VESGCGESGGFGGKGIHISFQRITSNVNYLYMREPGGLPSMESHGRTRLKS